MSDLRIEPCRSECDWAATHQRFEGESLFACSSCGSEWVVSQEWTPANADGLVPAEIQQERARAAEEGRRR